jgi:hypothetical protein
VRRFSSRARPVLPTPVGPASFYGCVSHHFLASVPPLSWSYLIVTLICSITKRTSGGNLLSSRGLLLVRHADPCPVQSFTLSKYPSPGSLPAAEHQHACDEAQGAASATSKRRDPPDEKLRGHGPIWVRLVVVPVAPRDARAPGTNTVTLFAGSAPWAGLSLLRLNATTCPLRRPDLFQ